MLRNNLYEPWFMEDNKWGVKIISGAFDGAVIQLEKLEFSENGDSSVDVELNVIKPPDDMVELDTSDAAFSEVMSTIISDILKEAIADYEQNRNNDSSQPSNE